MSFALPQGRDFNGFTATSDSRGKTFEIANPFPAEEYGPGNVRILEEGEHEWSPEEPYLFSCRSVASYKEGDFKQLGYAVRSGDWCLYVKFIRTDPDDSGFEQRCGEIVRTVKVEGEGRGEASRRQRSCRRAGHVCVPGVGARSAPTGLRRAGSANLVRGDRTVLGRSPGAPAKQAHSPTRLRGWHGSSGAAARDSPRADSALYCGGAERWAGVGWGMGVGQAQRRGLRPVVADCASLVAAF